MGNSDVPPQIDTSKPHPARVYDYFLGGKDNFAADREVARKAAEVAPSMRIAVRENRAFLGRAVRYLVAEAGITQSLDLGSGLPGLGNVHEVAQAIEPSARRVCRVDGGVGAYQQGGRPVHMRDGSDGHCAGEECPGRRLGHVHRPEQR